MKTNETNPLDASALEEATSPESPDDIAASLAAGEIGPGVAAWLAGNARTSPPSYDLARIASGAHVEELLAAIGDAFPSPRTPESPDEIARRAAALARPGHVTIDLNVTREGIEASLAVVRDGAVEHERAAIAFADAWGALHTFETAALATGARAVGDEQGAAYEAAGYAGAMRAELERAWLGRVLPRISVPSVTFG